MFMKWKPDGTSELNFPLTLSPDRAAKPPTDPKALDINLCLVNARSVLEGMRQQPGAHPLADYQVLQEFGWSELSQVLLTRHSIRRCQCVVRGNSTPRGVKTSLNRRHWQLIEAVRPRFGWNPVDASDDWIQQRVHELTGNPSSTGTLALLADLRRYRGRQALQRLTARTGMKLVFLAFTDDACQELCSRELGAEYLDLRQYGVVSSVVSLPAEINPTQGDSAVSISL